MDRLQRCRDAFSAFETTRDINSTKGCVISICQFIAKLCDDDVDPPPAASAGKGEIEKWICERSASDLFAADDEAAAVNSQLLAMLWKNISAIAERDETTSLAQVLVLATAVGFVTSSLVKALKTEVPCAADAARAVSQMLDRAVTLTLRELRAGIAAAESPQKFVLPLNRVAGLWWQSSQDSSSLSLPPAVVWECFFLAAAESCCEDLVEKLFDEHEKRQQQQESANPNRTVSSLKNSAAEVVAKGFAEQVRNFVTANAGFRAEETVQLTALQSVLQTL